jgi:hypothetical protein
VGRRSIAHHFLEGLVDLGIDYIFEVAKTGNIRIEQ